MRISSSVHTASLSMSSVALLETPAVPVQENTSLDTSTTAAQQDTSEAEETEVVQKISMVSSISPVLGALVSDFGGKTGSQRQNPGTSTVSRVDMSELVGHSTSDTLLYLVDYDPDTYTGKDGNLFVPLATSLAAGEEKVTRRFDAGLPLNQASFNNLADKMPNRYLDTERFGIQLNRFEELRVRSQQLNISQFQDMLDEMMKKSAADNAEDLKENIEKSQEKMEYTAAKVDEQPVDDRMPVIQTQLSESDKQMLRELAARDLAVRAHETAHMAAGAGLTGGASYTYQVGPDGRQYAVGGEVSINISEGTTPQGTLSRAQRILAAATAPADPSAADNAVAMQASRMIANAQAQISQEKQEAMIEATPVSEKREEEQVDRVLPPEEPTTDSFTGKSDEQTQLTQEQAAQSSLSTVTSSIDQTSESTEEEALSTVSNGSAETLSITTGERAETRELTRTDASAIDEENELPTFTIQDGQLAPTEPTTLDTDNLPDVKIQDATLYDTDVTTIAGRQSTTQIPDQTALAESLDPEDTSTRFIPEARVTIPTNELIASEQQIQRNLNRGQEGTPTLDDLLNAPVLLNNPLNDASPEQDEVALATENSTETVNLSSVATQAGPIATAAAVQKVEPPTIDNSPQERTTQESNTDSPFSLSQTETQTRFAVTQPSFISLVED